MNEIITHENISWQTTNKILRSISIHDWRNYNIQDFGAEPRNERLFIIHLEPGILIRLYDRDSSWGVELEQKTEVIEGLRRHTNIRKGRLTTKNEGPHMFVYSIMPYLSSKNPKDLSVTEHRLFRLLKNYFTVGIKPERMMAASNWKANAIA